MLRPHIHTYIRYGYKSRICSYSKIERIKGNGERIESILFFFSAHPTGKISFVIILILISLNSLCYYYLAVNLIIYNFSFFFSFSFSFYYYYTHHLYFFFLIHHSVYLLVWLYNSFIIPFIHIYYYIDFIMYADLLRFPAQFLVYVVCYAVLYTKHTSLSLCIFILHACSHNI